MTRGVSIYRFAVGFLVLLSVVVCRCSITPLSAVKLIYNWEGPVSCNQPISISVMAAWQHPAVPDVPLWADGVLVSSAVLLRRSQRKQQNNVSSLIEIDSCAPVHLSLFGSVRLLLVPPLPLVLLYRLLSPALNASSRTCLLSYNSPSHI